jgi:hypothetical protein
MIYCHKQYNLKPVFIGSHNWSVFHFGLLKKQSSMITEWKWMVCFTENKKFYGKQNVYIHNHNMWKKLNLHVHHCNTVLFKKSVINMDISLQRIFKDLNPFYWITLFTLLRNLGCFKFLICKSVSLFSLNFYILIFFINIHKSTVQEI